MCYTLSNTASYAKVDQIGKSTSTFPLLLVDDVKESLPPIFTSNSEEIEILLMDLLRVTHCFT